MRPLLILAALVVLSAGAAFVLLRQAPGQEPLPPGLVFVSEASGAPQVHALLPDGGERVLTQGPRAHFPAGRFARGLLVVESQGEGDDHVERLLLLASDGGVTELLGEARRARSPAAGDGFVIAESSREGFSDLWRLELDGGAVALTHDSEAGSFEPQLRGTSELVHVSSRDGDPELYALPLDGGAARRLTSHPAEDLAPRVSPDGRVIVFTSSRGGSDALYVLREAPEAPSPLHRAPLDPGPKASAAREDVERDAAFTPDGREVVFAARRGGGHLRVWAVEVATGSARALTDGKQDDDQPAVTPDGREVVFARGEAGRSQLWVVPLRGGEARQLTRGSGARWLPQWAGFSENQ